MVVKDVLFIDESSNVAVVTLWTRKELVASKLKGRVHAVGTLYTVYGINYLLHTLAERPVIDTLILFGADLSSSGEALIKLFNTGEPPPGLKLMWPLEEVKPIIEGVRVVDLRDAFRRGDWEALHAAVEEFYDPAPPRRPRLELELREPEVEGWPVPVSGQLVVEESLFRAWVRAVYAVMTYGCVKGCEYGERQKQLLNLVVSINLYGRRLGLERELLTYFSEADFEEHYRSLLSPEKPEGVSYTYGERLRRHPLAGDQLLKLVERLRGAPDTRRALAVLWRHDVDPASREPPCLVIVQGDVTAGYYNHTAYIRSNDMYAAWPLNAYAQVKLAERIAQQLGLKVGVVTIISCSAHVYEHDWGRAWDLIHRHYDALKSFVPDPRGSFILSTTGQCLQVEHRAPDGRLAARLELRSRPYRELKAIASTLASDHAFYLGWEARRALERAARGEEYRQDDDLR